MRFVDSDHREIVCHGQQPALRRAQLAERSPGWFSSLLAPAGGIFLRPALYGPRANGSSRRGRLAPPDRGRSNAPEVIRALPGAPWCKPNPPPPQRPIEASRLDSNFSSTTKLNPSMGRAGIASPPSRSPAAPGLVGPKKGTAPLLHARRLRNDVPENDPPPSDIFRQNPIPQRNFFNPALAYREPGKAAYVPGDSGWWAFPVAPRVRGPCLC